MEKEIIQDKEVNKGMRATPIKNGEKKFSPFFVSYGT
jgi:hypothetical protein